MKYLLTFLLAVGLTQFAHANEITLTSKNTVVMNQPFSSASVTKVQSQLAELAFNSSKDLYLVLNSPGGSISAGQSLIDFAKALPNRVHTITIFAASMAYLTAQHLDRRYVIPSGQLMSHRARIGGLSGQVPGEANSRLRFISQIVKELFQSTAKRVGVPYRDYLGSVYDELWLTAKEAVNQNHADEIITAKCDKSLSGTYTTNVRTFFGTYKVTFSKCPLISGPLKISSKNTKVQQHIRRLFNYKQRKTFDLTL